MIARKVRQQMSVYIEASAEYQASVTSKYFHNKEQSEFARRIYKVDQ